MKRAILHVDNADGPSHTETYGEGESASFSIGMTDDEIRAWAKRLIDNWNATLRPHESRRTLTNVDIESNDRTAPDAHDWHKTNAVTISDRLGTYDAMRCERCGCTGKRYGLLNVTLDSKFKAGAFQTCAGALRLLEKRKQQQAQA